MVRSEVWNDNNNNELLHNLSLHNVSYLYTEAAS